MASNKLRTALTTLGMVIGITSIIIVFSAGAGINQLLTGEINAFGTDILEIEIKVPTNTAKGASDSGSAMSLAMGTQITTLTLPDLEKILALPNVKNGYGAIPGQEQLTYGSQRKKVSLFGANASFVDIDKSEVARGRFFSDAEDRALSKEVVIGAKIAADVFGNSDPLGKSVAIGKEKFEVIGIMKERGASGLGMDFDSFAYVPIRTLQKRVMGINHVMYMVVQLEDMGESDRTAEAVRALLRERHKINFTVDSKTGQTDTSKDDFRVTTMQEMMATLETVTNAITLLLLAIVAISLIVGGVGIMNIMYVIVSERTREIGLRKAVGAKLYDILGQFLIESIFITFFGAIIGIILGLGLSFLIAVIARSQGLEWTFIVPGRAFIVTILFSLVFGIVFGIFPARKAALLDPISALRNE
jgi:putative ABC transport system permease protein